MKGFGPLMCLFAVAVPAVGQGQGENAGKDVAIEVGRAGAFEVGMTLREIFVIVEPEQVDLGFGSGEGYATPMVFLDLLPEKNGPEIIGLLDRLECPRTWEWNVNRLRVRDPRYRTADGVGVGSTLEELHQLGWVDSAGRSAARAREGTFPLISFIFSGKEGECEGCAAPDPRATVSEVQLLLPAPEIRERCALNR